MKKAITVLGLGAAAVAMSVSNANAMEQIQTTNSTNLREQPSATSNKISELEAGTTLTLIQNQGKWSNVKTEDGKTGWVSNYYVSGSSSTAEEAVVENNQEADVVEEETVNNDTNINEDQTENIKTGPGETTEINSNGKIVNTGDLNIRTGPSVSNALSGIVYKGEIFKVVSRASNGWYKVVLNDGTTGWASGKYITLTNEEDKTNIEDFNKAEEEEKATESEVATNSTGRVNSSVGLNIRGGAGREHSVIGALKSNELVNIIGEEAGWYKIQLSNGQTGYVGSSFITVTNEEASNIKGDSIIEEETTTTPSANAGSVVGYAKKFIGTPYSWGGNTPSGFDCSGFTQYVYKNAMGIDIPRISRDQASAGRAVSMNNLQEGDLLYFDTMGRGSVSHVGIYVGNGQFVHASGTAANPEHVKVSNLGEGWAKCLGARRF